MGDDLKIKIGAGGGDLEIYHQSSNNHSYIKEAGSGSLIVLADDFYIQDTSTNTMISAIEGGAVTLHHNSNARFATSNDGATLTGRLTPATNNDYGLGSAALRWANFYAVTGNFSGTVTANAFSGNITGNVTGNTSGSAGSCTGNAATATTLATARTIAGVSFDGSANISLNNNAITNGAGYITATLTEEQVEDYVGGMVTGNTETGITVTYQDSDGTLDFVVASQTDNNFTTALKNKLDGIAASATNVTNNNQLTNGAGYLTSASANDGIFWENNQNVTSNYTITNGKNAMTAGPITIDSGVTVTIGSGEYWTIL